MRLKVNDTPYYNLILDLKVDYESEKIEVDVIFWKKRGHVEKHWIYPAEQFGTALNKYRECEATISATDLWHEFGDVPMNPETECIEADWRSHPAGTHREEIWHWFENTFGVRVADLMYGTN